MCVVGSIVGSSEIVRDGRSEEKGVDGVGDGFEDGQNDRCETLWRHVEGGLSSDSQ